MLACITPSDCSSKPVSLLSERRRASFRRSPSCCRRSTSRRLLRRFSPTSLSSRPAAIEVAILTACRTDGTIALLSSSVIPSATTTETATPAKVRVVVSPTSDTIARRDRYPSPAKISTASSNPRSDAAIRSRGGKEPVRSSSADTATKAARKCSAASFPSGDIARSRAISRSSAEVASRAASSAVAFDPASLPSAVAILVAASMSRATATSEFWAERR